MYVCTCSIIVTPSNEHVFMYSMHIWQMWVEIEHYFVAYFDCITVFEALYHRTSVKGGAHTRCLDLPVSGIDASLLCI